MSGLPPRAVLAPAPYPPRLPSPNRRLECRLLKERNGAASLIRFEKALMLSKAAGDKVLERRAVRGLAAASRLQGQYRTAIKHLERVLVISKGETDAHPAVRHTPPESTRA